MKTTPNHGLEVGGFIGDGGQEGSLDRNFQKIDKALGIVVKRRTNDDTQTWLTSDGNAPAGEANLFVLPDGALFVFDIRITAKSAANDIAAWQFIGAAKRVGNYLSIPGELTSKTLLAADFGTDAWDVVVATDDITKTLVVAVTGEPNTVIDWTATITMTAVQSSP